MHPPDADELASLLGTRVTAVRSRSEQRTGSRLTWLDVELADGGDRRLVLKVGGRDGDVVLHRALGHAVPGPRVLDAGAAPDGTPFRLVEVAVGPTFAERTTSADLRRAVTALAAVHALPCTALEPRDATGWLWERAADAWPAFREAVGPPAADRFAALVADPPERPGPVVLCHGDAHPGNVVLTGDGALLVDWEDWRLGPGAEDLAFLLGDLEPPQRRAWARAALETYAAGTGRRYDDVRGEVGAALAQLPKMLPFWWAQDPQDPAVVRGLDRQWGSWTGGLEEMGL